jgi:hypothetical protein
MKELSVFGRCSSQVCVSEFSVSLNVVLSEDASVSIRVKSSYCTRSPFVHRLSWLALCSRWKFLWDTGGIHWIGWSLHYFLIMYLHLRCKVCKCSVNQKSYSNKRNTNGNFIQELVNCCFRWSHSTTPHLYRSLFSTTSIIHLIPLSASNLFSCLKFSVCNLSYLSPTVSWMYIDS